MSKNTRWALAIVGVVIIIVGAIVIGTGKDNTDAVKPAEETTTETGPTKTAPVTPQTGSTGTGTDNGGNSGSDNSGESGGASPDDSGSESGGASPDDSGDSGGAQAQTSVLSPVLSASNVKTVKVDKGETVIIRGRSGTSGEMHVHGYDKEVPLEAGKIARVKIKATIDGEFAIEFHLSDGGHVDVGTLRVNP